MSGRLVSSLLSVMCGLFAAGAPSYAQETSDRFKQLDRNGDGKLTKDEFSGPIFDRLDSNQDGVVSAEEDRALMRLANRSGSPGIPESVTAELNIPYAGTKNPGSHSICTFLAHGMNPSRCPSLSSFTVGDGKTETNAAVTG